MNTWYPSLNKPPLTPPNWVFSPVWTILYISIGISIVLYYRSPSKPHVALTSTTLVIHLLTNAAWTYLFFGLRSPTLALVDIVLLDISLAILIGWFWKASLPAAVLLGPYFLWVMFATYLNFGFYQLN